MILLKKYRGNLYTLTPSIRMALGSRLSFSLTTIKIHSVLSVSLGRCAFIYCRTKVEPPFDYVQGSFVIATFHSCVLA